MRADAHETRAELDRLVADLPADASAASSTVAERGPGRPSWHISSVGGLRASGPWRMERGVIVVSLIDGTSVDAGPEPGPGAPNGDRGATVRPAGAPIPR